MFRSLEFRILGLFRTSDFGLRTYQRGFTLIELLLVVALIAILGALSSPFLSRFLAQNYLQDSADKFVRTLRKAQNYALSGKEDSKWGVHYDQGELILFKGGFYGEDSSFDERFEIPATINVSGWSDVTFSRLRGKPSINLVITISSSTGSRTVILNQEGMVDVQ